MKRIIPVIIVILFIIAALAGRKYYQKNYAGNIAQDGFILIPHDATFTQIQDSLAPYLDNPITFKEVAESMNLPHHISAGRYKMEKGANNRTLVNMIKAGLQTEDSYRIINFDDVYQMLGRVSRKTEADSLQFVQTFNTIAKSKSLKNAEDLKPYFFADTYNFYWTVKPEDFFARFEKMYNEFWDDSNKAKEKELGLGRNEVYALASIVEKESGGLPDEQRRIAGLYLNRYRIGMKLQSDPTVIYAISKENNFSKKIKRVYYKDLRADSPYNTYKNIGMPPGPICIVSKSTLENVLNAEKNDYLYMVADPNNPGHHKFTRSDAEHMKNAREYQDWLNEKQIK